MTQSNPRRVPFVLALLASAGVAWAQADAQPQRPARQPDGVQPPGERPARPGRQPGDRPGQGLMARADGGALMHALDANRDGAISSDEINVAATALKVIDANQDARITFEEIREYAAKNVRPTEPPRGPEGAPPGEPPRRRNPDAGPPPAGDRPTEPPGEGARRLRMGDGGAFFAALDKDRDRVLSAEEIAGAPAALKTLDADKDGAISAQELRDAARRNAVRAMFNDANNDGVITRDEVPERMRERFDDWDTNQDGHLDKAEQEAVIERMRQRRPEGEPRGDGPPPPPDR